jgi:FKBP-type peptidyl-prolyl cis-trans isomerase SlyD
MIVSKDKVVSVIYQLTRASGNNEIIETVNNNNPLVYISGYSNLLNKFEANLQGLKAGDKFDFILTCKEAYGEVTNDAIVEVPNHVFMVDGVIDEKLLTIGNVISMMDQAGNQFRGRVLEKSKVAVKMDFNHPLAGESLHFKGEIVEIRDATDEEIKHGLNKVQSGCCCGCEGNCESDCN